MAKLCFKYGAMGSGKSTLLQQIAHNCESVGLKAIVVKPQIDTKGGNTVVSRIGLNRQVDILLSKDKLLMEETNLEDVDYILVDEAQFLTVDQVNELRYIASMKDITVMCFGLRTDFMTNGFDGSTRLLQIADTIEEIVTICCCGSRATMNARKVNGEYVFEGEQVCIDNKEKIEYVSLCSKCYIENYNEVKN